MRLFRDISTPEDLTEYKVMNNQLAHGFLALAVMPYLMLFLSAEWAVIGFVVAYYIIWELIIQKQKWYALDALADTMFVAVGATCMAFGFHYGFAVVILMAVLWGYDR